jgi:hypothetical protein
LYFQKSTIIIIYIYKILRGILLANQLNQTFLQLPQRAEKYDRDYLASTFVDVGELFTLLSTRDNHILYGRRGTGKSHIFFNLANKVESKGHVPILIDMRTLGSSGGIYADPELPISERASRLLVDTLVEIHAQLLDFIWKDDRIDQSKIIPIMDNLLDNVSKVSVVGTVEIEETITASSLEEETMKLGLKFSSTGVKGDLGSSYKDKNEFSHGQVNKQSGIERHRVHFGSVQKTLSQIISFFENRNIWILLDEWSEVPLDLQPYLGDLLRRTVFPIKGFVVKIAALEQRSRFRISTEGSGYIGLEVGAEISTSINLDEHIVFENDSEKAKTFFETLIFKHAVPIMHSEEFPHIPSDPSELVRKAFTQKNVFDEFVKAAEGVPRDAINILSLAALSAGDNVISVHHIRDAAKKWYNRAKENAVVSKPAAQILLRWIIDEVIKHRKARAFLLRSDVRHELIDFLYDARVIHIVKQNVSAHDQPGVRFNVYSVDYGCYVELINTSAAPLGLFSIEDFNGEVHYVQVPETDYRSIRRAILDLDVFEAVAGR